MGEIRIVGPGKTCRYPYPVCKKKFHYVNIALLLILTTLLQGMPTRNFVKTLFNCCDYHFNILTLHKIYCWISFDLFDRILTFFLVCYEYYLT